jgi:hypothetical protein
VSGLAPTRTHTVPARASGERALSRVGAAFEMETALAFPFPVLESLLVLGVVGLFKRPGPFVAGSICRNQRSKEIESLGSPAVLLEGSLYERDKERERERRGN